MTGHERKYCPNSTSPAAVARAGSSAVKPAPQPHQDGCAVQIGRVSDNVKAKDDEYVELKSGKKLNVVRNGACI